MHNRPIARQMDDSVAFVIEDAPILLRRARGYAPSPIPCDAVISDMVAVGAHQKNAVAVAHSGNIFLSQYLGDMEHVGVRGAFKQAKADFTNLYDLHPEVVACDMHPDYPSTRDAEQSGSKIIRVQHHYAHILSCMAEHQLEAPVLGVAWDGNGYGIDGSLWGGEFLRVNAHGFTRAASMRPFPLPGGELAAREPRRSALGILYAMYGADLPFDRLDFSKHEFDILLTALKRGVNAPMTFSVGRLFDAVAALTGLRQRCSFEGQAAMALEHAQLLIETDECYPFEVTPVTGDLGGCERMIEWMPMIEALLQERDMATASAKFHNTLAAMITTVAEQVNEPVVVLSGGCFQNRALLEQTLRRLRGVGFRPYWQQQIPPNDGGIAIGQIVAAIRETGDVSRGSGQDHKHSW